MTANQNQGLTKDSRARTDSQRRHNDSVRVALKTAVNVGRNKVDSMRSYLETLLGLLKYMSSPFQNILRIFKYHLFDRVLYSFLTSAKN